MFCVYEVFNDAAGDAPQREMLCVYKSIMTWFSTIFNDDTLNCRFSQILAFRLFPALRVFWKIYRKSLETCAMFEYYLPYL